jgi:ADP-heptose:LPS heptosyltransferase
MSGLNNELKQVDRKTKQKVDNEPLLFHLRFLAMKDYHIELYKVLRESSNNKDNVFLLLSKKFRSNPKNKADVELALTKLINSKEKVEDICNVRDKFYAHLDKDYLKYTSKKSYPSDVHNIFVLIENAIIVLTSFERLNSELNKIESREDYSL